jgi:hypothetical protein
MMRGVACHCIHQLGNDGWNVPSVTLSDCAGLLVFGEPLRPDELLCGFQFSVLCNGSVSSCHESRVYYVDCSCKSRRKRIFAIVDAMMCSQW